MTDRSGTGLDPSARPAPRKSSRLHRRALLRASAATAESIMLRAAGRQAFANQASEPRKLKLAWNASAICTASTPVAQESGIFAENGFEIEFVTFGSSTEQLLEAIAARPPVTRHPPQSSPDPACLAQLGRRAAPLPATACQYPAGIRLRSDRVT